MKIGRLLSLTSLVAVTVVFTGTAAHAAAGGLDTTFGTAGTVVTNYNGYAPSDALLQPDGKIIVVADFANDPNATVAFGLLRYQSNGTLDSTFGVGGRASTEISNSINYANDAALQSDGKIVVAGEVQGAGDGTMSEFAVVRFTASGALDTTFGTGGKVTTNFLGTQIGGAHNSASAVLLQPDGKVLVGGSASVCPRASCGGTKTALARYNANGTLDTTFGTGGMVSVLAIGAPGTLAEDASGNIFALDGAQVAQFSPTGTLLGKVTPAPIAVSSHAGFQVAPTLFQSDGRYLVATGIGDGTSGYRHDTDATVARYQQTGAVDATFTTPAFDFGAEQPTATDLGQDIAQQANGKVVLAGYSSVNGTVAFVAARLNPGGGLDTTFGSGGIVTANLPAGGQASVVLIQPDGKILVIGQGFISGGGVTLVLLRYLAQ